jgi:hypothetical protein
MSVKDTTQDGGGSQVLHFKEKRKWQISLRRYILEGNKCSYYAPFFAIDSKTFRQWIELQFDEEMGWHNFSSVWQFDHIVPVAYFDFDDDEDMKLCWNFTNIRVEKCTVNKNRGNRVDVLSAKSYFEELFARTQYPICQKMIEKIEKIEGSQIKSHKNLENFIVERREYLMDIAGFTPYEFEQLNSGVSAKSIRAEKDFLKKYG